MLTLLTFYQKSLPSLSKIHFWRHRLPDNCATGNRLSDFDAINAKWTLFFGFVLVLWFFGYYWIPQKYHNPNRLLSSAFFRPPIMIYLKMIQKLQFTNWLFLFQGNETREIFFSFKVNKVDDAARKIRKEEQIYYVPLYLYLFPHPYVIPM